MRSFCCERTCPPNRSTRCSPPGRPRITTTPSSLRCSTCSASWGNGGACTTWQWPSRTCACSCTATRIAAGKEPSVSEPDPAILDRLRRVRGFVLDMDGTLVLGDRNNKGLRPLPGAEPLFATLTELGLPFRIFTNGTSRTPRQYAHALQALGFPVTDDG